MVRLIFYSYSYVCSFKSKQWSDAAEAYRAGLAVAKTCGKYEGADPEEAPVDTEDGEEFAARLGDDGAQVVEALREPAVERGPQVADEPGVIERRGLHGVRIFALDVDGREALLRGRVVHGPEGGVLARR